ncbi:MAG: hypothetical protein JSV06_08320, partial [Myxococcales bacterium]
MKRAVGMAWVVMLLVAGCSKKADEVVPEPSTKAPAAPEPAPLAYVGTTACAQCHEEQHEKWLGSHHDLAMQRATTQTVLGDFNNAKARYYKETARFLHDADGYAVEALGADGERASFPVVYTFGVEPLQQYLVEVARGRLQALPFAWDTRPK